MKILLQPSSGKEAMNHFEDTIENGVSINLLRENLSQEEFRKVNELKSNKVKTWGFVSSLEDYPRKEWEDIDEDDLVLFYKNKKFFYIAKIHSKVHNKELAKDLWGADEHGRFWEYVYFIKEGKSIEIPYKPEILKRKDGEFYKKNHIVQGAILLEGENKDAMKKYIEIELGKDIIEEEREEPTEKEEDIINKISSKVKTYQEVQKELKSLESSLANKEPRQRIRIAKSVAKNSKLARLIKEKSNYICEICGQKPFIKKNGEPYAEAHHVEELSKGGPDLPSNLICVCPTCHMVIHHGSRDSLEKRKLLKNK
jgi:hypothetical protein